MEFCYTATTADMDKALTLRINAHDIQRADKQGEQQNEI